MRGWKVHHDEEDGILSVGSTRGKPIELRIEGYAKAGSGRRYLLYSGESEELTEKHEHALLDFLEAGWPGAWDLMSAEVLSADWNDLSPSEQDRMARREGFQLTRHLP